VIAEGEPAAIRTNDDVAKAYLGYVRQDAEAHAEARTEAGS